MRSKQGDTALWATLLFSLKEAFYKLQYPITRQFVDFKDITISQNEKLLKFESANPNINLSPVLLSQVETHWIKAQDQLISICYISVK
ncbi:4'-phosphopantetheinyl transferase superfamily protein [Mucilaginibacter terrae]|uniref:4'-phosphopantetheinyl transferase superfamily protein n=1 Tax=Mucilaginibacter terrae TaxID=1955052 RepID=UPI0035E0F1D9